MKPYVASDWNQTLIDEKDDKHVLKQIAMDELKRSAWTGFKTGDFAKFWKLVGLKKQLESMVKEYRGDPEASEKILRKTYELYGSEVIPGMPTGNIISSVEKYARGAVRRLDGAFYELCEATYGPVLILTTALNRGVERVIYNVMDEALRKGRGPMPFFKVDGSRIIAESDDGPPIATGFDMQNYNNKREKLETRIRNEIEPGQKTIYMGNDFRDEPCAGLVDIFVVAPLATYEYRQMMAQRHGSKVRTPSGKKGEVYKALTMD